MLVALADYARNLGKDPANARQMAGRGSFRTAVKIGRDWLIDPDEPWPDRRRKEMAKMVVAFEPVTKGDLYILRGTEDKYIRVRGEDGYVLWYRARQFAGEWEPDESKTLDAGTEMKISDARGNVLYTEVLSDDHRAKQEAPFIVDGVHEIWEKCKAKYNLAGRDELKKWLAEESDEQLFRGSKCLSYSEPEEYDLLGQKAKVHRWDNEKDGKKFSEVQLSLRFQRVFPPVGYILG